MSVQRWQRFTRDNPCPICRGYEQAGRGAGKRCHGFRSEDGNFAHCTREEWSASALSFNTETQAWVHDLRRAPATERGGYSTRNGEHLRVPPPAPPRGNPMHYDYCAADGTLLFQVVRTADKRFTQQRPDGAGGVIHNLDGVPRVLYRLPELLASGPETPIYLVEGEKDVNTLRALGLVATTNPGGAGKWRAEYTPCFAGRQVVIVPDNDRAGWEHALAVAKALTPVAACVKVVALPEVAEKGDVTDWLNGSGSLPALIALVAAEQCWEVPQGGQDAQGGQGAHLHYDEHLEHLHFPQGFRAVFIRPGDVAAEQVQWLWQGYIPRGALTVVDGDPGLGKSTMMMDLAARLTTGAVMPDGSAGLAAPAGILMLCAEDSISTTIRPRLEQAGAAMARTLILDHLTTPVGERQPTIGDIAAIAEGIATVEACLVIIDPLMAFLPPNVNAYRDQDVRRVLTPLSQLAQRTGAAIVVVRHPNKMVGQSALHRGGGSIGIIGAARSGLLVAPDPHDPEGPRRILAAVKNNLAPPAPSLAYHIEGEKDGAGRIVWEGVASFSANQLIAPPLDGEESSMLTEAMDFLRGALADGTQPAAAMTKAAREAGITEQTLRRAKCALRCRSAKDGKGWFWRLPDAA